MVWGTKAERCAGRAYPETLGDSLDMGKRAHDKRVAYASVTHPSLALLTHLMYLYSVPRVAL